jgi:hypothetical protein
VARSSITSLRFATGALAVALAATQAVAQPGGQLVSSNALYTQGTAPASETSTGPTTAMYGPVLFHNWWYYRVSGDTRERPFGTYTKSDGFSIAGTSSYVPFPPGSNTATYNWTENGPNGVRFTATYSTTLVYLSGSDRATLSQSFQINNPNPTALDLVLFNEADWDVNRNTAPGMIASGNLSAITINGAARQAGHSASNASAFQVAEMPILDNLLADAAVNDLDNSGVPATYNYASDAFQ